MKHLLILVATLLVFSSCYKSNEVRPRGKIIKVVIEHSGDLGFYDGLLIVTEAIDKNQKNIPVSGVQWDNENHSEEPVAYGKSLSDIPQEIVFMTDRPASQLHFEYSAWLKHTGASIGFMPVVASIKFYINDELVKTETYVGGVLPNDTTYLGKLDTKDY